MKTLTNTKTLVVELMGEKGTTIKLITLVTPIIKQP